jgi:uncharacterized RDD family membrane protein YckC
VTCPACRNSVPSGNTHCPSCGATVAPIVEGSLAPDTSSLGGKAAPLREIPALRKRERTWKDDVRDRVRHRRKTRSGDLPLFDAPHPDVPVPDPPAAALDPDEILEEPILREAAPEAEGDFPLRHEEPPSEEPLLFQSRTDEETFDSEEETEDAFSLGIPPREVDPRPVERPARLSERIGAAAIDLLCLLGIWAVTLYFAGRISHVGIVGLRPAWRYVAGYLGFVGFYYAAYFTGTTGQTLGKIVCGLRVVDTAGAPPGYPRALCRAILAVLGIGLAGVGMIPVFFDPARRAFHDRIFRTRVVKG